MKILKLIILILLSLTTHAQWTSYNLPQDFPVYNEFSDLLHSSRSVVWARYSKASTPTYKSLNGGASFHIINNLSLARILPSSDSIVYALDWYSNLVKSNDGGYNFNLKKIVNLSGDTGFKKSPILDFHFYNDSIGWVIGDDTTNGCKEIWRTANGGLSWSRILCSDILLPNVSISAYYDYKKSEAGSKLFMVCSGYQKRPKFIVVDDFGKKWSHWDSTNGVVSFTNKFVFLDSLTGVVRLSNQDLNFASTADGGFSWKYHNVKNYAAGKILYSKPTSNKRGFLISGGIHGAFISYDTAKTWIMIDDYWHSNISFYDAETGISMTQPTPQRNGAIHVFNGYLPDPVGLKENHQQSLNLKVFPNPAQQVIYVRASNVFGVSQISIFDVTGKEVQNQTSSQLQTEIPITHLNTGMYFLRMVSENGEISFGKFYVQN